VTVAADSAELLDQAGAIFRSWEARLADRLLAGGVPRREASPLATTLIAGCEGAVVLSRAERSIEPFDRVARSLRAMVAAYGPKRAARTRRP
jgi:TetR/AcrR family transcriptional regulator, lmrAB and yxaGH operons repressor